MELGSVGAGAPVSAGGCRASGSGAESVGSVAGASVRTSASEVGRVTTDPPSSAGAAVAGTSGLARSWTWGLPWALVLLGVIDTQGGGRFDRAVARIGDASYSTYLVHPCLIALLWRIGGMLPECPALVLVALVVTPSTVAGLIVHRWIERPLLQVLARQRKAAAPVATDAALA